MRSLLFVLLAALPSAALAQSDSLTRQDGPTCWRGKPAPLCQSFWITELSGEYPYATTSTTYTSDTPPYVRTYSRRDVTPQVFWTIGPMWNTSPDRALGLTVSAGFVNDGGRFTLEGRRRYWTSTQSAFDLSAGVVRMNVPPHGYLHDGYGLTAGAYALGGDLVHINTRADLLFSGRRVYAGGSVGAGLGGYGAVGGTVLLGVLVAAVVVAFASSGDF